MHREKRLDEVETIRTFMELRGDGQHDRTKHGHTHGRYRWHPTCPEEAGRRQTDNWQVEAAKRNCTEKKSSLGPPGATTTGRSTATSLSVFHGSARISVCYQIRIIPRPEGTCHTLASSRRIPHRTEACVVRGKGVMAVRVTVALGCTYVVMSARDSCHSSGSET